MCPYGSVSLHLCHEDRPRNPELKDSEERLPIRAPASGAPTADSRIVGFGGAFSHPAAGRQSTERRVKCVLLIGAGLRRRRRARMAAMAAPLAQCRSAATPGGQIGEVAVPAGRCPGLSVRLAQDRGQSGGFARDAAGRPGTAPKPPWTRSTAFFATQGASPTGSTAACCGGTGFRTARRCS